MRPQAVGGKRSSRWTSNSLWGGSAMPHYTRMGDDPAPALPLWQSLAGVLLPSFVTFVLLDAAWIGLVASDFYKQRIGSILKPDVDAVAALGSWMCIVVANWLFVLQRTLATQAGPLGCLGQGALLGVLLYGTVDLTNCALIKDWGWTVTLVDMCWGTTACALTALVQNRLHLWLASRRGGGAAAA